MTRFSDLKLDPKVLKAVEEAGYDSPTPIQAGAIPPAVEGRDVLGIAQTGTGKTASFTLPMITLLGRGRARARMPRSLVLCPTRELAAQVAENFDIYAKYTRLTKALLIGGVSFAEQDKLIDRGVDVLIATPGRLLDHFERGKLLLTGVQIMVVDEADRMLDMGFIPDIERIFQLTPFTRQTLFFSATMAPEIERITNTFLHNPERIEVARQATTSDTIEQRLIELTPTRKDQTAKQKRELMRALIDAEGEALKNAIIFCNRKTEVDIVAKSLRAHGYDAAPIHGDLDQSQRMRTLDGFREGTLRFLVASDVAARGLDIPAVSHVFNFDLPSHAEDYVHRIGRTGRAGRKGIAISLCVPMDDKYLAAIENLVKQTLPRAPMPEGFVPSEGGRRRDEGEGDRERAGRGGRSRSGSRRRRDDRDDHRSEAPRDTARQDDQPVAAPAQDEDRREARAERQDREDNRAERRDRDDNRAERRDRDDNRAERRDRDDNRAERREDRRDPPRERDDRRGNRNDRRDDRRGGGAPVMGMGEHVPEFLTRSFLDALAATERMGAEAATRTEPTPETVAEVRQADTAPPAGEAEKPKRRSRSRRKKGDAVEVEALADTATGVTVPTGEAASQPVPAPESEGQTAETVPQSDVVAEPAAPAEAQATPAPVADAPKPRRTRRKKAETEAAAEAPVPASSDAAADAVPVAAQDAAQQAAPEKPKRTRRKKADPAPEAPVADTPAKDDAATGTEALAEPAKPKRTRRKKADAEAAPDADAPADSVPGAN